jgi:hypothetical protein
MVRPLDRILERSSDRSMRLQPSRTPFGRGKRALDSWTLPPGRHGVRLHGFGVRSDRLLTRVRGESPRLMRSVDAGGVGARSPGDPARAMYSFSLHVALSERVFAAIGNSASTDVLRSRLP